MKARISAILCLCLLTILAMAATASALPITIEQVKIDGVTLRQGQVTRLDIEKNQNYDVDVLIEAHQDIDDMELKVFVSGFEYSLTDRAEDHQGPYNMDADEVRKFTFTVDFSDEFDQDDYLLRVMAFDKNDEESVGRYPIKLDVPRHSLKIEDILFYPETRVESKEALMASVRIENNGEKIQEDIKVRITIPDLDLAASTYINEIEAGDEKETEEIYLRMPECGTEGLHEVEITVTYGEGHYQISDRSYINFLPDASCNAVEEGEGTVELIIAETQENTEAAVPVEETEEKTNSAAKIRKALEVLLLVLVVLLVIIGLVIGFSRLGRNKEEEDY